MCKKLYKKHFHFMVLLLSIEIFREYNQYFIRYIFLANSAFKKHKSNKRRCPPKTSKTLNGGISNISNIQMRNGAFFNIVHTKNWWQLENFSSLKPITLKIWQKFVQQSYCVNAKLIFFFKFEWKIITRRRKRFRELYAYPSIQLPISN